MKRLALAALLLMLAGASAVAAAPGAPLPVSVDQVWRDHVRLEGRTVRLTGVLNQCDAKSCVLCPDMKADPSRCLSVETWAGMSDDRAEYEVTKRIRDGFDQVYRFADVEVVAVVDYTNPQEAEAGAEAFAQALQNGADFFGFCGGERGCPIEPQVWLVGARVEKVLKRRAAVDGLVTGNGDFDLIPYSGDKKPSLMEALDKAGVSLGLEYSLSEEDVAVFLYSDREEEAAYACAKRGSDFDGRWPAKRGQLRDSPANLYRCFLASYDDGAWRFTPM